MFDRLLRQFSPWPDIIAGACILAGLLALAVAAVTAEPVP